MLALAQYHFVTLIVALAIGVVTAWWVSPRRATTAIAPNEDPTER